MKNKKPTAMNYLTDHIKFETVEEGEKQLAAALKIRNQMGGALYYNILTEDCEEIRRKLEDLRLKEKFSEK